MAITWKDKNGNVIKVTHKGLVLRGPMTSEVRVMSDIYSYQTRCLVWDPEKGCPEEVVVWTDFDLYDGPYGEPVVDATPEVMTAYRAFLDKQEALAKAAEEAGAREKALREWNPPKIGRRMRVVRGRKVPKGTEGTVFWVRDGRCGLARSDARDERGRFVDVAWVDAEYVENVAPFSGDVKASV